MTWVSSQTEREHLSVEYDGHLEIFYLTELVISRNKMGSKGSQGSCSLWPGGQSVSARWPESIASSM